MLVFLSLAVSTSPGSTLCIASGFVAVAVVSGGCGSKVGNTCFRGMAEASGENSRILFSGHIIEHRPWYQLGCVSSSSPLSAATLRSLTMESPGRPTVFSDRIEMERILYDLMKNPTVCVGRPAKMWHYLTDMEADTDMPLMQSMQPVMDAFAKFRADLRISQRAWPRPMSLSCGSLADTEARMSKISPTSKP